jgi:hypothetical protein
MGAVPTRLLCPSCRTKTVAEAAIDAMGNLMVTAKRQSRRYDAQPGETRTFQCSPRCGGTSTVREDKLRALVSGAQEAGFTAVPLP